MTNKMTYVQAINAVMPYAEGEVKERLEALIERLSKPHTSKSTKPSKSAIEAQERRDAVLAYLTERGSENPASVGEIAEACGLTPNQTTSAVTKLSKNAKGEGLDLIERTLIKGKPYFAIKAE